MNSSTSPEYSALPSPSPLASRGSNSPPEFSPAIQERHRTPWRRRVPLWLRPLFNAGSPGDVWTCVKSQVGWSSQVVIVAAVVLVWLALQAVVFRWSSVAVESGLTIRELPKVHRPTLSEWRDVKAGAVGLGQEEGRELAGEIPLKFEKDEEKQKSSEEKLAKLSRRKWKSQAQDQIVHAHGEDKKDVKALVEEDQHGENLIQQIPDGGDRQKEEQEEEKAPSLAQPAPPMPEVPKEDVVHPDVPKPDIPKPEEAAIDDSNSRGRLRRGKAHVPRTERQEGEKKEKENENVESPPHREEHHHGEVGVLIVPPPAELGPTLLPPRESMVAPSWTEEEMFELQWNYLVDEKVWPYIGTANSDEWKLGSKVLHGYYNRLAVFPGANDTRQHGMLGLNPDGRPFWTPDPMPPKADNVPGGLEAALKNGGFYLNLSNALPLDRLSDDGRDTVCLNQKFHPVNDLGGLDVSIIITFYNEPFSTLMRSVHSILDLTPPHLIREIILVDDHSNITQNEPGGMLDQYVKLLPKVKLMRLPERRGIVIARLAGAKLAKAPVLVVLDSHIEVNVGWLEPQLARLHQSPQSVVFPQIYSIESHNFNYNNNNGIGCFLSFKWMMQERSYLQGKIDSTEPIASPSMAGGLFAVKADWFWELGGYDEEFSMWGAENVEMGFRVWMCGGRMECTPCSRVYHIYRQKGSGYESPSEFLLKNRIRTARLWTGHFFPLAERFIIDKKGVSLGPFDQVLSLQERLQCRNFSWYLEHVDVKKQPRDVSTIEVMGEFRNEQFKSFCIDTLAESEAGKPYGVFPCHGQGGTQGFMVVAGTKQIRLHLDETNCLGNRMKMTGCESPSVDSHWDVERGVEAQSGSDKRTGGIRWDDGKGPAKCLGIYMEGGKHTLKLQPCNASDNAQKWTHQLFKPDPNFQLPTFSPEWVERRRRRKERQMSEST